MRINRIDTSYSLNNLRQRPSIKNEDVKNINYSSVPIFSAYYPMNISFRGGINWESVAEFTSDMGKRIYSKRNVIELSGIHSEANGITQGRGIPEVWLSRVKDIENFDKDNFIKRFSEIFVQEREYADVDRVCSNLRKLFEENGIIGRDTPFSVKYIGHGYQAWAYKTAIDNNDEDAVVTKLFKRTYNYLQNHGNHTEQNLAEYIKNYGGDNTEFVKYYYGDTQNGLLLVDYVPDDIQPIENKMDLSDIGVGYDDYFPKNVKKGHIFDFGGIVTVNNLVGNRTAQEIYKKVKYGDNIDEKLALINEILDAPEITDEIKDKAIGVVHGIKFLPKDKQAELYLRSHKLNSHRVNIALEQNFESLKNHEETKPLIEELIVNAVLDEKEEETIAKEIKHVPDKLRHQFFENYQNTKLSAIIKYLARNINQYYKDLPNRVNIYNKFIDNSDRYAAIALINSMKYMGKSRYDNYFEKFFAKNDIIINTTLARSLELFNESPDIQKKWIDKLSESKNVQITAALAESLEFINPNFKAELLEKLLPSKDKVTKEYIAKNIVFVPRHEQHPEWVEQLMNNADNMVRATLATSIKDMKNASVKKEWSEIISRDADDTVKNMLNAILNS